MLLVIRHTNKLQISGRSLSNGRMMGSFQHGTEYSDSMKGGVQLYSVTLLLSQANCWSTKDKNFIRYNTWIAGPVAQLV